MANRKYCVRIDQIMEDSEWLAFSLEIFSRAYQFLNNFTVFFKLRVGKYCGIDHDRMPLYGALSVVTEAMKSQRPGLFRDLCSCTRRDEHEEIPGCIIQKVNTILLNMEECCVIENIVRDVKDVLCITEEILIYMISLKLKMLSYLLKEVMKKLISCTEKSKKQFPCAQMKWLLQLVNNFIRDWSIKNSRCRFCNQVASKIAQEWGTYCCKTLQLYYDILEEWALLQLISTASKEESIKNKIKIKQLNGVPLTDDGGSYTRPRSGLFRQGSRNKRITDYEAGGDLETARWTVSSPQVGFDRTIKLRGVHGTSTLRPVDPGVSLRKTEPESYEKAGRGPDKFDRVGHSDLEKAMYHRGERETVEGTRKLRNIDKDSGSPIAADRREERDDVPGGGNAGRDREQRGTRGADEEGTAVGKMRKIKTDKSPSQDRKKDRLLRSDIGGNGSDRSPGQNRQAGNRSRSRDPGFGEVAEDQRSNGETRLTGRKKGSRYTGNLKSTYKEVGADIQSLSWSKTRKSRLGDDGDQSGDKSLRDQKTLTHEQSNKRRQSLNRPKARKSKLGDDEQYNELATETKSSRKKKLTKIPNSDAIEDEPVDKREKKVSKNQLSNEIKDKRVIEGTGDEAGTTGRRADVKEAEKGKNYKMEETADISESASTRERRKKKADAVDSKEKGTSRGFDEEESVPKRDGKRTGRSSGDEADSGLMKKGKDGKTRSAGREDKSTPNSEYRSKKGRRERDSSQANDDYGKINGDRYRKMRTKVSDLGETERRGLIEYQLSNQHFVNHGWSLLPISKTMRKVVQYQAKPAKPHLNWFERHKYEGRIYYNDGATIFVNFHPNGTGEVFHPNGRLAIEVCKPANQKYGMYTVFTPGGKDCVGVERKSQVVGVFDTMGNGAVFDEDGATRLSYNQIGGIWGDNPAGPPLLWKWDVDEKNLVVETVYVEKSAGHIEKLLPSRLKSMKSSGSGKAPTSPASSRNKEKKVVEQKPVVAVHDSEEEVMSGAPNNYSKDTFQLKMICMKLTDHISLRISNRRNIYLQFFADGKSIRIELGTILNFNKEMTSYYVDTSSKAALFKCKFDDLLTSHLEPESSLHKLVQELREVKKSAKQRKFIIKKYKPYLLVYKNAFKSRCRP